MVAGAWDQELPQKGKPKAVTYMGLSGVCLTPPLLSRGNPSPSLAHPHCGVCSCEQASFFIWTANQTLLQG